ncbi:hypothetical protein Tco_1546782 [Tanacetum coccineum]
MQTQGSRLIQDSQHTEQRETIIKTTELLKTNTESENILLKETVAQFQKDFSRMEAHCIALELKYQNQSLKSGQRGQILNETSNKSKIEKEFDVLETMNIELEHSCAAFQQTTSLLANNAELKAQIQEKVFAIAALKNDLRTFKGNSVDTKFDKTSVLGKPLLPSLRNQSVVRQPNAFKSARAQMSKQRFASQVDLRKDTRRDRNSTNSVLSFCGDSNNYDDRKPNPRGRQLNIEEFAIPKTLFVLHVISVSLMHHDACITKLLKEVNSRAKIQSNKTTNRKSFDSCMSKVDSEPPHGFNVDIPSYIHEWHTNSRWENLSSGLKPSSQMTFDFTTDQTRNLNVKRIVEQTVHASHENAHSVHQAAEDSKTSKDLDSAIRPLVRRNIFNGENQVVLKSSADTTY